MNFNFFNKSPKKETLNKEDEVASKNNIKGKVGMGLATLIALNTIAPKTAEGITTDEKNLSSTEANYQETEKSTEGNYVASAEDLNKKELDENSPEFKFSLVKKALENPGNVYVDKNKPGYIFINKGFEYTKNGYAKISLIAYNLNNTPNYYTYDIQFHAGSEDDSNDILDQINKKGLDVINDGGVMVRDRNIPTSEPIDRFLILGIIEDTGKTTSEALEILAQYTPGSTDAILSDLDIRLNKGNLSFEEEDRINSIKTMILGEPGDENLVQALK